MTARRPWLIAPIAEMNARRAWRHVSATVVDDGNPPVAAARAYIDVLETALVDALSYNWRHHDPRVVLQSRMRCRALLGREPTETERQILAIGEMDEETEA